jgi:hypothetical protein
VIAVLLPVGCGNGGSGSIDPPGDASAAVDRAQTPGAFQDFSSSPMAMGGLAPSDADALAIAFGPAGTGDAGGPCLEEPAPGATVPRNLPPLLVSLTLPPGDNVVEVRVHVDNQGDDLVLFSDSSSFTLPEIAWGGLQAHSAGHDLAFTTRSARWEGGRLTSGPHLGSQGVVHLAPVDAPGVVMYWTTTAGSAIKAFHIGDRTLTTLVTPAQMRSATPGDHTRCVGCHTSSPDGTLLFLGRGDSPTGGPFGVDARVVDGSAQRPDPDVVAPAAIDRLLRTMQIMPTLSPAHYGSSDAQVVTVLDTDVRGTNFQLVATDLHGGQTTVLQRSGDRGQPDAPSFSHDGTRLAYASSDSMIAIYGAPAHVDLYTVPYENGNGGTATPLAGASTPDWNEYYPVYSPDDAFLAFNRIPAGNPVYNAPAAEVFIVPSTGGNPVRVAGNDPPACAARHSPGITNSWPRWAPSVAQDGDDTYYWLVFSSRRRASSSGGKPLPQLYISAIVVTTDGKVRTYPAVYLPTQSPSEANHTPAWDEIHIPTPG